MVTAAHKRVTNEHRHLRFHRNLVSNESFKSCIAKQKNIQPFDEHNYIFPLECLFAHVPVLILLENMPKESFRCQGNRELGATSSIPADGSIKGHRCTPWRTYWVTGAPVKWCWVQQYCKKKSKKQTCRRGDLFHWVKSVRMGLRNTEKEIQKRITKTLLCRDQLWSASQLTSSSSWPASSSVKPSLKVVLQNWEKYTESRRLIQNFKLLSLNSFRKILEF